MTAPGAELTPAAIQSADTSLTAYLEARGSDFRSHGWSDDGIIEARDGRSLTTTQLDVTLRRARAAETERDQARAANTLLRHTLGEILRNFTEKGHPGEPCLRSGWVPIHRIREARDLLTAIEPTQPQGAPQPDAAAPARAPLPPQWVNSSSTPQGTAQAVPAPEELPGHPGKLAEPPAYLKPTSAYSHQPSPGHIAAYKLDHCGSCRDAEFYGWSGLMMERAHGQHLGTVDVGPLAGQPCRCKRCTGPVGSGTPDA